MIYPKRLIEVDLPIKRIAPTHGGRSRSGTGTSRRCTSGGRGGRSRRAGGHLRIALARPGRRELPPTFRDAMAG